jgi:hypothetical protein
MTQEQLAWILAEHGYAITTERDLPDGTGWECHLVTGHIIRLFDDGNWDVRGKNPDLIEGLLWGESSETW